MNCKNKSFEKLKLSDFKMPEPNPEEVKEFIKEFRHKMKPNQIELLELFADKIYGFHLYEHSVEAMHDRFRAFMNGGTGHTCRFRFEHDGVQGEITIFI